MQIESKRGFRSYDLKSVSSSSLLPYSLLEARALQAGSRLKKSILLSKMAKCFNFWKLFNVPWEFETPQTLFLYFTYTVNDA